MSTLVECPAKSSLPDRVVYCAAISAVCHDYRCYGAQFLVPYPLVAFTACTYTMVVLAGGWILHQAFRRAHIDKGQFTPRVHYTILCLSVLLIATRWVTTSLGRAQ